MLAAAFPDAASPLVLSTVLPLVAGAVAGIVSTIASYASPPLLTAALANLNGPLPSPRAKHRSQPADVILTRTNEQGATLGQTVADVTAEPGLVLQGLAPRMLYGVLLVSLQFLFYTQLRGLLGVSKADLTNVLDALAVLRGT